MMTTTTTTKIMMMMNLTRMKSSKDPLDGSSVTIMYGNCVVTIPSSRSTLSLENLAMFSAAARNSRRSVSDISSCRTFNDTGTGPRPGLVSRP